MLKPFSLEKTSERKMVIKGFIGVFSGLLVGIRKYARIMIIIRPCVQTASSGLANINYA